MEKYLYEDLYNLEEKHWWHIAKRKVILNLTSSFLKTRRPKVLDIGCGTGKNVEVFGQIGTTYGIDNSPEAINFCQSRSLANIKLGTSEETGFSQNHFDLITLLDVLEHTDEDKTLAEVARILKNDGILTITVPAFSWLWSQWDVVLHHKRRYTKTTLTQALERNGFQVLKISYMYSFLVLPAVFIRFIKSIFYKKHYPSDFKISSPLINYILLFLVYLELKIMQKFSIPIGTSLVCIAQKYEED